METASRPEFSLSQGERAAGGTHSSETLMESGLYIVGTPIGNLDDFSPRGIETLRQVDVILAEDARHTRKLSERFGISSISKLP